VLQGRVTHAAPVIGKRHARADFSRRISRMALPPDGVADLVP
jgi:hypothetical protein